VARVSAAFLSVLVAPAGLAVWVAACGGPTFSAATPADGGPDVVLADALTDTRSDARSDATDSTAAMPDAPADAPEMRLASVTVVAMGAGAAGKGIALDGDRVYWADQDAATGTGTIRSVIKDGTGPLTIATKQQTPLDVLVDGTALYWSVSPPGASAATNCLAMVVSKATLDLPVCLTKANYTTIRMAAASSYIALLTYQGVQSPAVNPFLGFVPTGVLSPSYSSPFQAMGPSNAIAATDEDIFSANRGHVDEYTVGMPIAPAPQFCQSNCAGGGSTIVDMVIDATGENVLWVTSDPPNGGTVYSQLIPPQGMGPPATTGTTVGTVTGTPQRMARDASYVYVTTMTGTVNGTVLAVPLGGGATRTLAGMETGPFGVAVDEVNVYWTVADGSVHGVGVPQ
jgi:hypothetical protein